MSGLFAKNTLKPQDSHNLLAFTYNNIQSSTGVNDGALSDQSEDFVPGDFWCLRIANISGNINSNTKRLKASYGYASSSYGYSPTKFAR